MSQVISPIVVLCVRSQRHTSSSKSPSKVREMTRLYWVVRNHRLVSSNNPSPLIWLCWSRSSGNIRPTSHGRCYGSSMRERLQDYLAISMLLVKGRSEVRSPLTGCRVKKSYGISSIPSGGFSLTLSIIDGRSCNIRRPGMSGCA